MKSNTIPPFLLFVATFAPATAAQDYPIRPVSLTETRVDDSFWTPRMETNRQTTVWYDFKKCEETGRIDNFAKAGGLMPGEFRGDPHFDSDVYKVIEGASYTLATHPDPKLDAYLDALIAKISAAQEVDGYLCTARTLRNNHIRLGQDRWLNERGAQTGRDSHELYNLGHLYEAAVAHYQATGKTSLLNVAIRSADLVSRTWGRGKLEIPPGHQEIEIALVKLSRATGNQKYLALARFLLDCRGNGHYARPPVSLARHSDQYYSDHLPVTQQTEAGGHSVRSTYMYSAMADVAAIMGDAAYAKAVDALWQSVVGRKIYLTGGIGADAKTEGFAPDYLLPNDSYNETCAAIGNALWNQRMFLLHGDGRYLDVLERIIYNGFLSGVAMTGDKFFYQNPLESPGKGKTSRKSVERAPWFGTSCCPVNVVRFIPAIGGFIYATRGSNLFVNLYIGSSAACVVGGTSIELKQTTRYPSDGKVLLTLAQVGRTTAERSSFTLNLRIPGWVTNQPNSSDLYRYDDGLKPGVKLAVNGKSTDLHVREGFAQIDRTWKTGDTVTLEMEMPVRRVVAHSAVQADRDRFALERGPLVYCAEGADNGGAVLDKIFAGPVHFEINERPELLGGMTTIRMSGQAKTETLTCIPYYAWCHRGGNEMRVWFPMTAQAQHSSVP